jgi:Retinal pigment epithelial membrane protein
MNALQVEEVELMVSGTIPPWLRGVLLKNGPGTFKGMRHLFDGYGMILKVRFDGGRVYGANRYPALCPFLPSQPASMTRSFNFFFSEINRTLLSYLRSRIGSVEPIWWP